MTGAIATANQRLSATWFNQHIPQAWETIAPLNGWTQGGIGTPPFQARLYNSVTIEVIGNLNAGTLASNTAIGKLSNTIIGASFATGAWSTPLTVQNKQGTYNPAPASGSSAEDTFQIGIGSDGTITIHGVNSNATSISFHFFVSLDC